MYGLLRVAVADREGWMDGWNSFEDFQCDVWEEYSVVCSLFTAIFRFGTSSIEDYSCV